MAVLRQAGFEELFHRRGLCEFDDFFRASSNQAVSGHRARNCVRIDLGGMRAFLKREHFIPLKDYFESWWAGFGFVSKSRREWRVLQALRQHGIGCPEPLAVGASQGRAFLVVRELTDAVDLRTFLLGAALTGKDRVRLAALVANAISDLHGAGFTHPDLYAKHVFVDRPTQAISFVDFQRTARRRRVSWRQCWRDLAALHASLADDVVSSRDRLRCLSAYIRHSLQTKARGRPLSARRRRQLLRQATRAIERRTRRLLHRRKIRRLREPDNHGPGSLIVEYWRVAVGTSSAGATPPTPVNSIRSRGGPPP